MAILLATNKSAAASTVAAWRQALLAVDPGLDIRGHGDATDPAEIDVVVMWGAQDLAALRAYPNLKLICSMGAGVDHLMRPPGPPPGVPVARLKDVRLTTGMTEWVLLNVLRFHRQDLDYRAQQAARIWDELPAPDTATRRIGMLGVGELGTASVRALMALGFPVMGWSRGPKDVPGVQGFHGPDGLAAMLPQTDILVCLLPLTPDTRGVLDARTLAMLPRGAFLVNGARGGHVVQPDLLAALDSGQVAAAALDVFEPEPLPADHPLWAHPKAIVTPHVASLPSRAERAGFVARTIAGFERGEPLPNLFDPARGY
jgi:glyoxylate/hydroxypyruvate reductase